MTRYIITDRKVDVAVGLLFGWTKWVYTTHRKGPHIVMFGPDSSPFEMGWKSDDIRRATDDDDYPVSDGSCLPAYSGDMNEAMDAFIAKGLNRQGYVLHEHFGAYTQEWAWHVSKLDSRGVLQGFVAAETPAMALCQAILKSG